MTIAYKVVRMVNNKMVSVVIFGMASLQYELNTPVVIPAWLKGANLYPLLFSTQAMAINLARNGFAKCLVLECECEDIVEWPRYCNITALACGHVFEHHESMWPLGTVSYKKVTPVKIVYSDLVKR
jgi:hypothetical protein